MPYRSDILADSINAAGDRLTTFQLTLPRFVLPQFLTHRAFSRNAASSRAIPLSKSIAAVLADPATPLCWGEERKGMQATESVPEADRPGAMATWLQARDSAVEAARALAALRVHKQIANRLLEPFMWITVISSATDYENFFRLRCHDDAQPELRHLAEMMRQAYREHEPTRRPDGEWHLPLVGFEGDAQFSLADQVRLCVARCARVSYLTHEGRRDPTADFELFDRLLAAGHMSPFEHAAFAQAGMGRLNNFDGWCMYRRLIEQGQRETGRSPNNPDHEKENRRWRHNEAAEA